MTPAEPVATPATRPRRRWLQFSLRTFLVMVLLIAAACGWLGSRVHQAQQQAMAVSQLQEAGADVLYDYEWDGTGLYGCRDVFAAEPPEPDPNWIKRLTGVDISARVVGIDLRYSYPGIRPEGTASALAALPDVEGATLTLDQRDSDGMLRAAASLPKLRSLALKGVVESEDQPAVVPSREGQQALSRLSNLETLALTRVNLEAEGWAQLASLPNLRSLRVTASRLNNADRISSLRSLREIAIDGRDFGDDDLERLGQLPALEIIALQATEVTEEGVERVRRLHPGLRVEWGNDRF